MKLKDIYKLAINLGKTMTPEEKSSRFYWIKNRSILRR